MNIERWQKIKSLFEAAQELDAKKREKFLETACDGDAELRREVEKLLDSLENAGSFLENPAAAEVASMFENEGTFVGAPHATGNIGSAGGNPQNGKFVAGTLLADRYRITGMLGKGGMGEVYQAEDIKLNQTVALKFLPDKLEKNKAALERFHAEVRNARRVSHGNVCRVFDIGETADNRHFLSMEYIRGDDLSSLLRRIGRLPSDKAVEISRQLCFGLAAIHEAGILHRDLKPANVIIDSRGKARITDFGIAGAETELKGEEIRVGTPAYMSPEQITGREISVKSDVYSLGLLLYEIFTGKQAFEADSLPNLIKKHQSETPTHPSAFVQNIDPLVEQVIFRCLEKNPQDRPESALQVAMALPGGNPLEAAIAAGETPSPEMVAAAPKKGALKPAVAVSLLACVFISIGLLMLMSKQTSLHRLVPLEKSPEVLRERSRELAEKFGYAAFDSYHGFIRETAYLDYLKQTDDAPARWRKLASGQPAVIKFWYRQSPSPLVPFGSGTIVVKDPPNNVSGMTQIYLDTKGRLIFFEGVPPRTDTGGGAAKHFDWADVFKEAGFNLADFREAESEWTPVHAFDERRAWTGKYPEQPDVPIRVEAAAYRGRLVQFEIVEPWTKPDRQSPYQGGVGTDISAVILLAIFFTVLFVSAWLAIKNVRGGRSDVRGAFRVAVFLFAVRMLGWAFQTHHVASPDEVWLFLSGLQSGLFWSCFVGLMYLSFEPYLRKYTPERVISWNRLLAGDWRNPLIGRDILIGGAAGLAVIVLGSLRHFIPVWFFGEPPLVPHGISNPGGAALLGIRGFPVLFLSQIPASLVAAFMVSFLILFFTLLLRRKWLGYAAVWLLLSAFAVTNDIGAGRPLSGMLWSVLFPTFLVLTAARFGVLAMASGFVFYHLIVFYPVTTELSAWYAGDFILCALALLALAFYGFYTSLAGQPIFEGKLLADAD
ncbi:MAG TPA: serine/threonine-protein kinase [Pyrinomonadaceae bacterium]|nr:serine/threonine-protein kinase [Pyrinomonadaceae bacterium]